MIAKNAQLVRQVRRALHRNYFVSPFAPLVSGQKLDFFHARNARQEHPRISMKNKLLKTRVNHVAKERTPSRDRVRALRVP